MIEKRLNRPNISSALLITLLLSGLLVRWIYVSFFLDANNTTWPDEKVYIKGANEISNLADYASFFNDKIQYKREPVYAIILSLFLKLFPSQFFLMVRLFQSVISVLSAYLIYKILTYTGKSWIALTGFIYALFYPYYIYLGGTLLPETLYIFILTTTVLVGIRLWLDKKLIHFFLFSLLLALGFLTKTTALSLTLVLLPVALKISERIKYYYALPVSMLIFMLICSPFWYRNLKLDRKNFLLSRNDSAMMTENPYFSKADQPLAKRIASSGRMIPQNFKRMFTLQPGDIQSGNSTTRFMEWLSKLSVFPIFAGMVLGIFILGRAEIRFLYLFYLIYLIPYLIILGDTRYRLPIDFISIIILTLSLETLFLKFKK